MSTTIQRPPTVERGENRFDRSGRPPHAAAHDDAQAPADETTVVTGVLDVLIMIARGAGAVLDRVLAGAAWAAERGAERLRASLNAWLAGESADGPRGSTEGALRVLRAAGVIDAGNADTGPARATRRPQPLRPKTLIVERDAIKRNYVERLCRDQGHAVSGHADAEAAWEALHGEHPGLILIGGAFDAALGLCRRLRGHREGDAPIIVLLDWQGGRDHEHAARAAGADEYVDAPSDVGWLRLRLEAVAERVHRRVTAHAAAARQEAMWADIAKRVADAYAEQRANETALRRALGETSSAEARIRRTLAEIDRQVSDQGQRLRALEDAVAALAALQPRGSVPPVIARAGGQALPRREIRIPLDAIPSLEPEARGQAEREPLRLVRSASEEEALAPAGADESAVPGDRAIAPAAESALSDSDADAPPRVTGVPFVLRGAIRTALEPLGERAHQKNIGFGWHVAPDVPEGVVGDGGRFAQMLVHVVGHAIRATEEGEVRVSVRLGTQASSTLVLLGSVADSSPGLIPEDQHRLFEALGRDDDPVRTVSSVPGLALAGRLVRSMGGQIWFESERDHGTTVRFTMRLGMRAIDLANDAGGPGQLARRRSGSSTAAGLDFLVVGDIPEDRREATRALEERGHRVVVASDGPQALGMLVATPFDAVLLNLRMPAMDGFELAAVLRTLEGCRSRRLPIVALTAMVLAGDLERCAAAGIDACLHKPRDGDDVLGTVVGLLSSPQRRLSAPAESA